MTDPWYKLREPAPDQPVDTPIPTLTQSVYCAQCGYNLKTLPRLGRCPECGNEYKVMGIHRVGIYEQNQVDFPWKGFIAIAFELFLTSYMFSRFLSNTSDGLALALVIIFGIVLIRRLFVTYHQITRYLYARSILKRMRDDKS